MKAISLHQPWASLVAVGAKTIETRGRRTFQQGPIAIHATKRVIQYPELEDTLEFNAAVREYLGDDWAYTVPTGVVVATATLNECVQVDFFNSPPGSRHEWLFGDYSNGRWMWPLSNIVALDPPVLARGMQGLWNWEGMPA